MEPSPPPQPVPVPDALAYLRGRWDVQRTLRDSGAADGAGRFTGTAEFRRAGDGLWLHVEEGVLEWNGVRNDARRTLRMLPQPDGTAAVEFDDGRPFHHLDLRTGAWSAGHPCAADQYDGSFTVVSPDEWHLRWRVHGPSKNQLLVSAYRRLLSEERRAD